MSGRLSRGGADVQELFVKAGAVIRKGQWVAVDGSGYAVPAWADDKRQGRAMADAVGGEVDGGVSVPVMLATPAYLEPVGKGLGRLPRYVLTRWTFGEPAAEVLGDFRPYWVAVGPAPDREVVVGYDPLATRGGWERLGWTFVADRRTYGEADGLYRRLARLPRWRRGLGARLLAWGRSLGVGGAE